LWKPTPFIAPQLPNAEIAGSINVGNTVGGINWPGAAFDPETATFYGQANNSSVNTTNISTAYLERIRPESQLKNGRGPIWEATETPTGRGVARGAAARGAATQAAAARGVATTQNAAGARGTEAAANATPAAPAAARGSLTTGLEGLPIVKPPYGVLTAIDLNKGEIKFRVPHGDTPDNVRTALQRLGLNYGEKTGQAGSVGLLVTKTLVVVGDPQVTAPAGRARGGMLRAYDKQTGKEVGAVLMPAQQSGSPMTYMADGKQYIIVAVQGTGGSGGQYMAFALR
jgi:quinoprotein glucose dehydrogenase